jgi:hypothetical protein
VLYRLLQCINIRDRFFRAVLVLLPHRILSLNISTNSECYKEI